MPKIPDRFTKHGKHLEGSPPIDKALAVRILLGKVGIASTIDEMASIMEETGRFELASDLKEAVRKFRARDEDGTDPSKLT